jgi:hypothetical protein
MTWVDALGYLAALLVLATFSMKTMLPLRMTGIASNCVFYRLRVLHFSPTGCGLAPHTATAQFTASLSDATVGQEGTKRFAR